MTSVEDLQKALLEKLAELEHDQWIELMQNLFDQNLIHLGKYDSFRMKQLMKTPYDKLEEYQKESDRVFARKVLSVFLKDNMVVAKADYDVQVHVPRKQLSTLTDFLEDHAALVSFYGKGSYDLAKAILDDKLDSFVDQVVSEAKNPLIMRLEKGGCAF